MIGPAFSALCPKSAAFQDAVKMIPPSIFSEVTCFKFYDDHPCARVQDKLDLTVCTSRGEVIEFYQRQPVTTIKLDTTTSPTEISLNRTMKCERYYLILAGDVLYHLLRKDDGKMCLQKASNVKKYVIDELQCKVYSADDALPQTYNEYFEKIDDIAVNTNIEDDEISKPLQTTLNVKLTIARYNLATNLRTLEKFKSLRQSAAYLLYKEIHPVLRNTVFNDGAEAIADAVQIKTEKPWIKVCNQKVVMVISVCNGNAEALEEVQVLIHEPNILSLTYISKVYQEIPNAPYWRESRCHNVTKENPAKIAVVIDLKELQLDNSNKIEFCGVLVYHMDGKEKLLPFKEITLPYLDIMSEKFNVLASKALDKDDILAILATGEKMDLVFNRVLNIDESLEGDNSEDLSNLLSTNINMERVTESNRLLVHRLSPYHVLNGVMLVLHDGHTDTVCNVHVTKVSVYTRNESQIISLVHYINDAVPKRIVITPSNYKLVPLNSKSPPDMEVAPAKLNVKAYAISLLKQMSMLKNYYDKCIIRMNESTDENIRSKIGSKINIYACGRSAFLEFKEKLNEEMIDGMTKLYLQDEYETD